ncbi:MAG TPA: carboxypeptidase regulatory-like domain-containing protein [Myxococcaceae bacterium]|nr:carboxypeptidase regulatory-like domain-containing protein [Myxococcaceae bacterium]
MSRRPSIATWLMLSAAAGAVGAACADIWVPQPKFCTTNAECDQGQICFPDGCGDPGRDLKAQITFASQSQEFEITDPELQDAAYDQEMSRPPLFTGLVRQDTPTGPVPFTNSVTLKASGSALLLAGVSRRVELGMQPLGGQYALPVHTGKYFTLAAFSSDTAIPPVWLDNSSGWELKPGTIIHQDIAFPAPSALVRISGSLLLSTVLGPVNAQMNVQVLEQNTGRPLSQPAAVDAAGNFSVLAAPNAAMAQYVEILASPRETALAPGTIVPSHLFSNVPVNAPLTTLVLEVGEFGTAVDLTGKVLDMDGQPVPGATVYTERTTQDRNDYKSPSVQTDANGNFTVRSLPTLTLEDAVSLWAIPPSGSHAGTLQVVTSVPVTGGSVGQLHCPRRLEVRGQVLRPDGSAPAPGVSVVAEPVGGIAGLKPPTFSQEGTTTLMGWYSFWVDPGEYRLDFHSSDLLPRVSQRVLIAPQTADPPLPVQLQPFTLWNGRKLDGLITGFANSGATVRTPLPGATVELFRVTFDNGKDVSYSLAKTNTDPNGKYSLVLPTAPSSPDAGTPEPDAG